MDPEKAHNLAHRVLQKSIPILKMRREFIKSDNDLIGLAAGFDKNGDVVEALGYLGLAYAEIGSVTAQKCDGNPKPRIFRLPTDEAIINRMGLNGVGASVFTRHMTNRRELPIAVNVAKSNDPSLNNDQSIQDIMYSLKRVTLIPDLKYIALNISCPNTKSGAVTESKFIDDLLMEIKKLRIRAANLGRVIAPLYLKLSPDSTPGFIDQVLETGSRCFVKGYICGNTTNSREGLKTDLQTVASIGPGGMSGKPLKQHSLKLCQYVNERKQKDQVLVGCGGIFTGQDVYDYIQAGASSVQIYSALIYRGPFAAEEIIKEYREVCLKQENK